MTDSEKMQTELENPMVLLYDKKISSMKDLLPILEPVAQQGKTLLIIATKNILGFSLEILF